VKTQNQILKKKASQKTSKKPLQIKNIQIIDTAVTVYNMEVEGNHDYFVGENKVLVHNIDCKLSSKLQAEIGEIQSKARKLFRSLDDINEGITFREGRVSIFLLTPAEHLAPEQEIVNGIVGRAFAKLAEAKGVTDKMKFIEDELEKVTKAGNLEGAERIRRNMETIFPAFDMIAKDLMKQAEDLIKEAEKIKL